MPKLTESDAEVLRQLLNWKRNVRIQGPRVRMENRPDGLTVFIGDAAAPAGTAGSDVIGAKLTSKSGTLYAWTEAKPASDGSWSTVSNGLSGTTSASPAVDVDSNDTADLTNEYVVLVRSVLSDSAKPCWIIADRGDD